MLDAAGCAVRAELAVVRATAALGSGTLVTVVLATGADVGVGVGVGLGVVSLK